MVTDDTTPVDGGAAPVDGGAADVEGEATAGSYVVDEDAEFDNVEDAALADLGEDYVCRSCDDAVQHETGEASQLHRELPAPNPLPRSKCGSIIRPTGRTGAGVRGA